MALEGGTEWRHIAAGRKPEVSINPAKTQGREDHDGLIESTEAVLKAGLISAK